MVMLATDECMSHQMKTQDSLKTREQSKGDGSLLMLEKGLANLPQISTGRESTVKFYSLLNSPL